ncbi:tetratricopeptide repeat protein [Candidatus Uabimicrobium sp. HlEnr_7]|uniref:tetratricopeptide repeat protein n=1 Tax=Candidatus Uabimicrobium helgolandensis TaxID=3095367 RepID=UPI0035562039
MEHKFKFCFVQNGKIQSSILTPKATFQNQNLFFGKNPMGCHQIEKVLVRGTRIILFVKNTDNLNSAITKHIDNNMLVLEVYKVKVHALKRYIDCGCSKVRAEQRKKALLEEGNGNLFRTINCPECQCTIDLSTVSESLYIFCNFCESVFTSTNQIATRGHEFKICEKCGMFDFVKEYKEEYFYFLILVYGYSSKSVYLCNNCAHSTFIKTLLLNFLFILGIPSSILIKLKSMKGRTPRTLNFSKANFLAANGQYQKAKRLYKRIHAKENNHPGFLFNEAMGFLAGNNKKEALKLLLASQKVCSNYTPSLELLAEHPEANNYLNEVQDSHFLDTHKDVVEKRPIKNRLAQKHYSNNKKTAAIPIVVGSIFIGLLTILVFYITNPNQKKNSVKNEQQVAQNKKQELNNQQQNHDIEFYAIVTNKNGATFAIENKKSKHHQHIPVGTKLQLISTDIAKDSSAHALVRAKILSNSQNAFIGATGWLRLDSCKYTYNHEKVNNYIKKGTEWVNKQSSIDNSIINASFTLLMFLGIGNTSSVGKYKYQVKKLVTFLIQEQQPNGLIGKKSSILIHAIATLAIVEHFALNSFLGKSPLKIPSEKAIDYLIKQNTRNWKNTLATTWTVLAFKSARISGLEVPEYVWNNAFSFLNSITDQNFRTWYNKRQRSASKKSQHRTETTTAAAIVAKIFLGIEIKNLEKSAELLLKKLPQKHETITYDHALYYYFATEASHQMGRKFTFLVVKIIDKIVTTQKQNGSWQDNRNIDITLLNIMSLAIAYRRAKVFSDKK